MTTSYDFISHDDYAMFSGCHDFVTRMPILSPTNRRQRSSQFEHVSSPHHSETEVEPMRVEGVHMEEVFTTPEPSQAQEVSNNIAKTSTMATQLHDTFLEILYSRASRVPRNHIWW
jgi:hypothetical protein